MPLRSPWKTLDRSTVRTAPDRPGMYELGTADGQIIGIDHGVLRDEAKTAFAYGDAERIRWKETQTLDAAERVAEEHRKRLDDR